MIQDSINHINENIHPYFNWDETTYTGLSRISDSTNTQQPITEAFFQNTGVIISEIQNNIFQYDWIAYLLLGLLFGIALIWYFLPERLASLFNFSSDSGSKRSKDGGSSSPGFLISFFLFINYMITASLFIFLIIKFISPKSLNTYSDSQLLIYISLVLFIFYLFRLIFIGTNGFIFNTKIASKQQQLIYVNVDNLIGIILIPIIFLMMYTSEYVFILVGIIVILIVHLVRWLQSFVLGKSIFGFSVYHLFMYLCTLEIIPLLILIKLLKNSMILT